MPLLSRSIVKEPVGSEEGDKANQILEACDKRDFDLLRQLASSEKGLIKDEIRQVAWPILLGVDQDNDCYVLDVEGLPRHRDEDQVALDVNRSFVNYPAGESEKTKDARKVELSEVILAVLRRHPMLHYFQGYHDIVQVLLLALGINAAAPAVARLSLLRIRDFMLPTMSGTKLHLPLVLSILSAADKTLGPLVSHTQPFFALPAILTMYAHQIDEYSDIARLFDFLLANEAVVSVYLFAAIVLSRKDELLEVEPDEPEMLHAILTKLPNPLDLEGLIHRAQELHTSYPPERLPRRDWARIPSSSVLKTTRDHVAVSEQTLQDGERFFEKEATQIRRAEALEALQRQSVVLAGRYRKPLLLTSTAILVAVFSVLMRRLNVPSPHWGVILGLRQYALESWQRYAV